MLVPGWRRTVNPRRTGHYHFAADFLRHRVPQLLPFWLELLAVTAPGGIELDKCPRLSVDLICTDASHQIDDKLITGDETAEVVVSQLDDFVGTNKPAYNKQ